MANWSQPEACIFASLKFLRTNYRQEQISEEQQGDDRDDNCFHGKVLEFVAKTNVESTYEEERGYDADIDQIAHTGNDSDGTLIRPLIKQVAKNIKKTLTC